MHTVFIDILENQHIEIAMHHFLSGQCNQFQVAVVQRANMLYMYMPMEEVLQNEVVGMAFSVDTKCQFLATSNTSESWTAISYGFLQERATRVMQS